MDFAGKLVLITGGATGIGRAAAFEFGKEGARLALLDIAIETLSQTVKDLTAAGFTADGYACDLSKSDTMDQLAAKIAQERGVPDVLYTNAWLGKKGSVTEITVQQLRPLFEVNLFGHLALIQAFLPAMIARGSGWIANTTSRNSLTPPAFIAQGMSGYCLAKASVNSMTQCLAVSLKGTGVGVSLLVPDSTFTGTISEFCDPNGDDFQRTAYKNMEQNCRRPEPVARELVQGLKKGKFLVSALPGFEETLVEWAKHQMNPNVDYTAK